MHHHLEIIMPTTQDIEAAIAKILAPFDENSEDRGECHTFWDWYVIGGRWTGTKESCKYDAEKVEQFYEKLRELKITVSSVQCGKPALKPESQIPMVDNLWNEFFPTEDGTVVPCPRFAHATNQYDSDDLWACDICRVDEIPDNLIASHVIITRPTDDGSVKAEFMLVEDVWNGLNFMKVDWDGNVKTALAQYEKKLEHYRDEWREKASPKPDWICVTVDYHS